MKSTAHLNYGRSIKRQPIRPFEDIKVGNHSTRDLEWYLEELSSYNISKNQAFNKRKKKSYSSGKTQ